MPNLRTSTRAEDACTRLADKRRITPAVRGSADCLVRRYRYKAYATHRRRR
jgi:hypothetical protein